VEYEIVAVRSTARGTAARFVVNFGVSGQGEFLMQMRAAA
jgi:hypothetical protein